MYIAFTQFFNLVISAPKDFSALPILKYFGTKLDYAFSICAKMG